MSLPAGVSTFELLFGKTFDFEGTPLRTDLVITPSHELVWEATGDRLVPMKVSKDADEGVFGSVLLPHTDQAGFVDLAGNAITDWWYTVQSTDRKGRTAASAPKTRKVQAVTGQTSVDLDLIPINGTVGPVGSVALPGVFSVNGQTGVVTVEGVTDAALTAIATDVDSEFYQAQASTIGAVVDTAIAGIDTGTVSTSPQIGAMVRKLAAGASSCTAVVLGDSTSAAATGWFNLLMDRIGDLYPAYTVERRDWSHTNQRYELVPTVVQVGTAGARGFAATGVSTDRYFQVADSAATSASGELRAEFDVKLPAALTGAIILGGPYPNTGTDPNNRGWFVTVTATGTMEFWFSTDGTATTQSTRISTAALPGGALNTRVTLRAQWLGNNGSGANETKFYYSTNRGSTWTQLGATVTTTTANQTIFNTTRPTQLGGRSGTGNTTGGQVTYYGMKVFTSIAAGARPVIDFDTAQWNGYGSNLTAGSNVAEFTDWVGNTVQIDGTGNLGAMTGAPVLFVLNGAVSGQAIAYANDSTRFPKLTPSPADLTVINFSHNEIGLVVYRAPYKALTDAILAKWPDTAIVATIQNRRYSPATNITEHAIRGDQIAALAGSQRWALIDVAGILDATGNQASYINSDGIHPTQPGYDLIALEAEKLFTTWAA